jgi:hypothetical protein
MGVINLINIFNTYFKSIYYSKLDAFSTQGTTLAFLQPSTQTFFMKLMFTRDINYFTIYNHRIITFSYIQQTNTTFYSA